MGLVPEMDALQLSRIQFGLTAGFHYIFPPLSIGLGLLLVLMEGIYLRTKDPLYEQMTRFWVKVFGLIFAIGVASGIVLEFQFGTNWSTYSRYVGDVFSSALAAEGVFAFFLESGFLALLLFGWDRVGPRMHFLSTVMVALGAHFSAIWIIVANSWQQTPVGHQIVADAGGRLRAEITDFWAMVFNPSTVERFTHAICGAYQAGWITAEVGRQPWIVYGLLRTADAGSPVVSSSAVIGSIVMFGLIYLLLFAVFVFLLNDKIKKGPKSDLLGAEGQRA